MSSVSRADVRFDPFEDGFVQDPYDQYDRLRDHEPVHWSELLGGWVLTAYAEVVAVLRDPTTSVEIDNAKHTRQVRAALDQRQEAARQSTTLVLKDDPDHARLRRLIQQPFGPKAIAGMAEMITRRVDTALDDLMHTRGPAATFDVIADLAYPLPVSIFGEMLGIPEEDSPRFRYWTDCVARNLDPVLSPEERIRCLAGTDDMMAYLEEQVAEKRREPRDDVMSELVHATDDGDQLSDDELMGQLITLYVAGHEPTTSLIGTAMLALTRYPDQLERLRYAPELLANALLEFLRWDGPNQFVRRIATRELALADRTVAAGDVLYLGLAAANRDPARWGARAGAVDIERPDLVGHVQFGSGVHVCLGSHLARMISEIAVGRMIARFPRLEMAGIAIWGERMVIRGLRELPLSYAT